MNHCNKQAKGSIFFLHALKPGLDIFLKGMDTSYALVK